MCWKGKAEASGWKWGRRGRIRGMHAVFTPQAANDTTTVTTTATS